MALTVYLRLNQFSKVPFDINMTYRLDTLHIMEFLRFPCMKRQREDGPGDKGVHFLDLDVVGMSVMETGIHS